MHCPDAQLPWWNDYRHFLRENDPARADIGIDIAGEQSARRGERFEDYTEAVRNLARDERFEPDLARALEPLRGFRNVLIHEYVALDLDRVIETLDSLDSVERFYAVVHSILSEA